MFKRGCRNLINLNAQLKQNNFIRNILSSTYPCENAWEKRLETSLLKPIKMDDYAFQIFQRHDTMKIISPVDLDIYCNRALNDEHADNVKDMLHKVRNSRQYLDTLTSTHPAIIRLFIKLKKDNDLLELINDKVKYGLFPDNLTMNILMDYFIKKDCGNYAAQVAYHLTLQEDVFPSNRKYIKDLINKNNVYDLSLPYTNHDDFFSHITPYIIMYSLLLHLKQNHMKPKVLDTNEAKEVSADEEMLYLRVPYLKRYHFDDHFDLLYLEDKNASDRLLLAKSLAHVGNCGINDDYFNNIIGRSCEIFGLSLWRKFDKVASVLRRHVETDTEPALTKDSVDYIFPQIEAYRQELAREKKLAEEGAKAEAQHNKHLPMFDIDQPPKETKLRYDLDAVEEECRHLVQELESQSKVSNLSPLFDLAQNCVKANVELWEPDDVKAQEEMFVEWIAERETKLEKQGEKEKEIAQKRKELEEEENLLTYFDRENEVEILLDKAEKLRDLLKKQKEPPLQAKDHFKSTFERMTSSS